MPAQGAEFMVRILDVSARVLLGEDESGLARAAKERFDCVILDVTLPGKSGREVCRELHQQGWDVAVLMLTALAQLVDRPVGLKLGADDSPTRPSRPNCRQAGLAGKELGLLRYRIDRRGRVGWGVGS